MGTRTGSLGGVTVAVHLDDAARDLVRHASLLARQLDVPLHLIHAVEPILELSEATYAPMYLQGMTEALEEARKEKLRVAEDTLKSFSEGAYSRFPVTTKVLPTPFVTEAVLGEAAATGSSLILCGVGNPKKAASFGGFSTALSLMIHAPVPVLIFKSGMNVVRNESGLRLLVADDCREAGLAALSAAAKLAAQVQDSRLDHVHAANFNGVDIKNFSAVASKVEGFLQQRAASCLEASKTKATRYEKHFLSGTVMESIAAEAERFKPDIIVFGRHEAIHRRPLAMGAVPFRAIMACDYPVMVVPLET